MYCICVVKSILLFFLFCRRSFFFPFFFFFFFSFSSIVFLSFDRIRVLGRERERKKKTDDRCKQEEHIEFVTEDREKSDTSRLKVACSLNEPQ